ncbi:isthmin-1-like [Mercenaria mercenaria]|uniref:isthmin-1-like n=1 Tax=Mercenaria mercenaria TaxID=6596 RepID=UPI00234F2A18|nr:isthmin-1-like [Mercenaria mercenaria]
MEFSDISKTTSETKRHRKTNLYENTAVTVATVENELVDQPEKGEADYEQLHLSSKTETVKHNKKENTQNRNKIIIYTILAMLVLLYIAVIVLTVIVFLPKSQVHGGWSTWSSCGSCSISCDVGMQSRSRSCFTPYPSLTGDHCFGDSRDDRICLPGACSDGSWSSWSSWGTCSETCGGGVRSQTRTCTNPAPSLLGKACNGTPVQVSTCNKQTCPENKVAFTAYGISGTMTAIFSEIIQNYGNGYSNSTGVFLCTIPGLYYFSGQFSKKHDHNINIDTFSCYIFLNSKPQLGAIYDPHEDAGSENDASGYSLSLSGTFHLDTNDTVYIGGCSGIHAIYTDKKHESTWTI